MSLELLFAITTTVGIFVAYWVGKQVGRVKTYLIYSKALNDTLNDLVGAFKDVGVEKEKIDKITQLLNITRHNVK